MNKRVTIFIASHSGDLVKRMSISRVFLAGIVILIIPGLIAAGYIFYDYCALQKKSSKVKHLSETIASQQSALSEQYQQIKFRFSMPYGWALFWGIWQRGSYWGPGCSGSLPKLPKFVI